ncbi:hypothetical protein [Variovorax fucosicus]|uniref:hypothetical protein n=1 Tax=Variovorax fucosicus TaxID=3053517 RepID=UPI0025750860|nr:hypothetical protein [Variovorax sp. J22G47]MDM0058936.1 hypothetical protein [Variovorax sp. J22G47]
MLTTSQKANILAKTGVEVPAFPARRLPVQERHLIKGGRAPRDELDADAEQERAVEKWSQHIETLYVAHTAARAARSLREAEEARQLAMLQRANARPEPPDRPSAIDAPEHGPIQQEETRARQGRPSL